MYYIFQSPNKSIVHYSTGHNFSQNPVSTSAAGCKNNFLVHGLGSSFSYQKQSVRPSIAMHHHKELAPVRN
jgi:hypothetical protein